ncbi:MAG: ABC transporter ATP-binding protein [Phycisphaerae bacterium]|jgi:oligopeptide/dipeptide ABC transporter ATP-binding protein|nr:ABC transporter ATP-binding protein [Phycisphaerae bacterium]MDP7288654.1 ABC transporter ATP-binding protein [Phycisphaerae bacterium]
MISNKPLLQVRDLRTYFKTEDGLVKAVDGVSYSIDSGETFAIVGESGCGKSVNAFSIMGIVPDPPGKVVGGTITFEGSNLLDYTEKQMQQVRGSQISMVFQEPMSSLNPVFTCGNQIVEAINLHQNIRGAKAEELAIEMLAKVGIPAPAQRFTEYPHQMSGGMKQRVMIAMALSCNPTLLIADEPTTALDVTIQAQILDLIKDIQEESDLAVLLITHDLAVVAETAHRVGVMYASKMVETTDVNSLFSEPLHPYTQGLFRSLPRLGTRTARLETIPGNVPNPLNFPTGCKFHPRCPIGATLQQCQTEEPPLKQVKPGHWCACWKCPGYNETPPAPPTRQA